MFSSRLPPRLTANAFTQALDHLRKSNVAVADLTTTNPTRVGIPYPAGILSALSHPDALVYRPEALGMASARAAVAAHESGRGVAVSPDQVVLTASTSDAYSLLFKLLCNPGDQVLVPEPSYPLFELLTTLDNVAAVPYQVEYHGVWSIARDSLLAAYQPSTKAVLVVSPNNPTGARLRADDREWLVTFAQERGLALISDEVFIDYPIAPRPDATTLLGEDRVLTFTLGGLSKCVGLPQVKLGWMVIGGPDKTRHEALERLELIGDTYLSVSTPVQLAAAQLLEMGVAIRDGILDRIRTNATVALALAGNYPGVRVLEPEGGWACVLQVPSRDDEEQLVLTLLRDHHIVVHPGYFFDFHRGAHVIVSLLPQPPQFREALTRVMEVAS